MKKTIALFFLILFPAGIASSQETGEEQLLRYLRLQTDEVAKHALAEVHALTDWQARREMYRRQLLEMLGLWPMPPRSDLKVTVTGRLDRPAFVVEKLFFQSMPGLYVTANLYLPKGASEKAPAVLYVCGHLKVSKDGISYGNKAGYQHHPAWYAENGYVALIIDTLDLGEIEGEHHGTYRMGYWDWPSRGYTPAGVETWNAIRALDYLETRPEVDPARIGLTGRSGGGAYTWYVAGVDDRPSVLVPVAGITDMKNHIVDGAIEGHCDCMFPVNTYAWDFPILAALAAPRPLLLSNSDKDRIFPLDGVERIHGQLRRIYGLYGASDRLGLFISEGPHSDTQELQVAEYRWMNRWLKKDLKPVPPLQSGPIPPEDLKVFQTLPADQINTRIYESFVPLAKALPVPSSPGQWQSDSEHLRSLLREKVFNNLPPVPANLRVTVDAVLPSEPKPDILTRLIGFDSAGGYRLQGILLDQSAGRPARLSLHVMNQSQLALQDNAAPTVTEAVRKRFADEVRSGSAVAVIFPRGAGGTATTAESEVQMRRRFLLLGQSLEALQVWDTLAAFAAFRSVSGLQDLPMLLKGSDGMGVVALLAAVFEPRMTQIELDHPPASFTHGPSFPNVLRFMDMPQVLALALPRRIRLIDSHPSEWEWAVKTANVAGGNISFPK